MSQTDLIHNYLLEGHTITPLLALEKWGCFRVGARAYDLRKQGIDVRSRMVKLSNGKRVAEYFLVKSEGN